jgi:Cu-processing system ATP-binding protein
MIDLQNISKQFGTSTVLDNVSLHLTSGQFIGLIGPNACGKTTMIKSILGMVLPTNGQLLFKGQSITGDVTYKNNIGYMPQIGRYPENMTILQIVNMIKSLRSSTNSLDEELWFAFGVNKISNKKMSTLSGGTTQKVSATLAFLLILKF